MEEATVERVYGSVLLRDLPSAWFEEDGISEATKRDVLNPGVAILQQSCCEKENKRAILKTSSTPDCAVVKSRFPDVKANLIYKELASLNLSSVDPSCVQILISTAHSYGVQVTPLGDSNFVILGNLDMVVDFRKAFDKAVLKFVVGAENMASTGMQDDTAILPAASETQSAAASETQFAAASETQSVAALGSTSATHGPHFSPDRFDVYKGLNPDILGILNKVPNKRIPGVHYDVVEGVVYVEKGRDDKVSMFQSAYQSITKIKVDLVDVPTDCHETPEVIAKLDARYDQCVFSFVRDTQQVRIASVSPHQFDAAKRSLLEKLHPSLPLYTVPIPGPGNRVLTLKKADIVKEEVDAIVNAANNRLQHSGGVALAINRASNGVVQKYSDTLMKQNRWVELSVGSVSSTRAGGALKCKNILHAVGPTQSYHDCRGALKRLVINIIKQAAKVHAKSIAIPAISSGIFGVDKDLVAQCILETLLTSEYPKNAPTDVRVVIIDQPTYQCFVQYLQGKDLIPTPSPKKKVCSTGKAEASSTNKNEDVSSGDSDPKANSDCDQLIQLLLPIASKWRVLARVLGLANEIGMKEEEEEEVALDSKAKMERVIRKFRQEKAGEDWVKVLTEVLKRDALRESKLSDEIRRVFSLSYPSASSVDNVGRDDNPEVKASGEGMSRGERTSSPDTPTSEANQTPTSTTVTTAAGAVTSSSDTYIFQRSASDPTDTSPGFGHGQGLTGGQPGHGGYFPSGSSDPPPPGFRGRGGGPLKPSVLTLPASGQFAGKTGNLPDKFNIGALVTASSGGGGGGAENMPNRGSVPTSGALSMGGGAADVKPQTSYAGITDNRRSDTTLGRGTDVTPHAQVPQHVKSSVSPGQTYREECSICLSDFTNPVRILCGHIFCRDCILMASAQSPYCPICKKPFLAVRGNQPPGGEMKFYIKDHIKIPGYPHSNTIEIEYMIPSGIQNATHPNPGKPFQGTFRKAYLPNNKEGSEVLKLLRKAFEAGLIFTVGTSHTTGQSDVVVWNDIHHKTSPDQGPYGYPDAGYLERVKADLAAKGIVP